MPVDAVSFVQPRLMPLAAQFVKAELTLHYDGPRGTLDGGYRIRDVIGDELLAMGAFPLRGPSMQPRPLAEVVEWLDQMAHTYLSPF